MTQIISDRLPADQRHRLYAKDLKQLEGAKIIETWADKLCGVGIRVKTKSGRVYLLELIEDPDELNAFVARCKYLEE